MRPLMQRFGVHFDSMENLQALIAEAAANRTQRPGTSGQGRNQARPDSAVRLLTAPPC